VGGAFQSFDQFFDIVVAKALRQAQRPRMNNKPLPRDSLNTSPIRFILEERPAGGLMRGFIWLALALLLLFAWIGSFIMYHVAGFLIHLLLIFALISFAIHLFTGRRITRRS
jgi:hypothetical protein